MRLNSLRAQLLFWLLAPLALVAALDVWASYRLARDTATIVQERMLLGAARVIGEQIRVEEDVIEVVIPPAALELFVSPARDRVFYRVSAGDGALLSGYYDLALPPRLPLAEEAAFFDTVQRERAVHAVAFMQPLLSAPDRGPVLIEVAQTLEGRDALAWEVWSVDVSRQLALLLLVGVLLWFGLRRGLRPLLAVRDRMGERVPGSLVALETRDVPLELRPVVAAVNEYVARLHLHISAQQRFIADASHQLRTPLTVLNTQVTYALRRSEPLAREEALRAIHLSVQHSVRLVQQLLAFTMAEAGVGAPTPAAVDLAALLRRALESLAGMAQQRGIDLGFESQGADFEVIGSPQLLYELVANLVDNALRYTPEGGRVTAGVACVRDAVVLTVTDNGPGIPPGEREKVFERFYRLHDTHSDGCGLGLSIVREIATASGARVVLGQPSGGAGLLVTVTFPGPG